MQPSNREMQAILNQSQMTLQNSGQQRIDDSQIQHFDPTSSHDDFLDQMLSTLPSWPDLAGPNPKSPWDLSSPAIGSQKQSSDDQFHFDSDQSAVLSSKLRQQQISGAGTNSSAVKSLLLQQQLMLQSRGGLRSPTGSSGAGDSCLLPMPLSLGNGNDFVDAASFKSPNLGGDGSIEALYNGFAGSLNGSAQTSNQGQHFHQSQNYGAAAAAVINHAPAPAGGGGGGGASQPRQRVRARRGQATDPHSIAERLRRERIAERMKALQELVPNANKTDKASMLDEIIDYVKFLQLQVKVLSMSRLGGAAAVAPLVADISSEGGGDCIQASGGGVNGTVTASAMNNNINESSSSMTVTEHQVAKLMEEDMGSAMQYLQGKGLCLMPISLATAISAATCHSRSTNHLNNPFLGGGSEGGGGPSSPNMSVLTVQSTTLGNGSGAENAVKDGTSVSKP